MKTRLTLIVVALAIGLTVQASTYYGFKLGGVSVTDANCRNITGQYISANYTDYSYKASYDHSTKTLTLENVKITRTGNDNRCIYNESCDGLTVLFKTHDSEFSSTTCAPIRIEANTTFVSDALTAARVYGNDGDANAMYVTNKATVTLDHATMYFYVSGNTNAAIEGHDWQESLVFHHSRVIARSTNGSALTDFKSVKVDGSAVLLRAPNSTALAMSGVVNFTMEYPGNSAMIGVGTITNLKNFSYEGTALFNASKQTFVNGLKKTLPGKDIIISNRIPIIEALFPDPALREWLTNKYGSVLESAEMFELRTINIEGTANTSLKAVTDWTGIANLCCLRRMWINGGKSRSIDLSYNKEFYHLRCYDNTGEGVDWNMIAPTIPTPAAGKTALVEGFNAVASERNNLPNRNLLRIILQNGYDFTVKNGEETYSLSANEDYVGIDRSHFPDGALRTALYSQKEGADAIVKESENNDITSLALTKKGINDLTGIEYFPNLKNLYCDDNNISEIDISKNPNLVHVRCYLNKIKSEAWDQMIDKASNRSKAINMYCYRAGLSNEKNDCPTLRQVTEGNKKNIHFFGYTAEFLNYIPIDDDHFPDTKFREYLLSQNYGADAKLTADEIDDIKTISFNNKGASAMNGIGYFTELTMLQCYNNALLYLDLSKNKKLEILQCYNNKLENLDLSNNKLLTRVECSSNELTTLNITGLDSLTYLECNINKLESLDLAGKKKLWYLTCWGNNLTTVDLTGCDKLQYFICWSNQIKEAGMDAMVATLPGSIEEGNFKVYNPNNATYAEGNVMTKAQVAVATQRGAIPYWRTSAGEWQPYSGIDAITRGDVNDDGNVDVTDVVALANYTMGEVPDGTFVMEAANMNGDEDVDVSDVVAVANHVLGE